MKISKPINAYPATAHHGEISRTIKANYQQTSMANLFATSTFGATGVMTIITEDGRRKGKDKTSHKARMGGM